MNEQQHLETLQDIRRMMDKSSRFLSLSGLSGVGAGICALAGSYFAYLKLEQYHYLFVQQANNGSNIFYAFSSAAELTGALLRIALWVLLAAIVVAFIFTYRKSKQQGLPVWDGAARRLVINLLIPLIAGGIFILKLLQSGSGALIVPACLIFYGLSLFNAGKYAVSEVRYLGITEIITGIVSLFFVTYGLYFWAFGFGILHIIYGIITWNKYDRNQAA